jgi:hypothetical protein
MSGVMIRQDRPHVDYFNKTTCARLPTCSYCKQRQFAVVNQAKTRVTVRDSDDKIEIKVFCVTSSDVIEFSPNRLGFDGTILPCVCVCVV